MANQEGPFNLFVRWIMTIALLVLAIFGGLLVGPILYKAITR